MDSASERASAICQGDGGCEIREKQPYCDAEGAESAFWPAAVSQHDELAVALLLRSRVSIPPECAGKIVLVTHSRMTSV
jgi:hypothetical protein